MSKGVFVISCILLSCTLMFFITGALIDEYSLNFLCNKEVTKIEIFNGIVEAQSKVYLLSNKVDNFEKQKELLESSYKQNYATEKGELLKKQLKLLYQKIDNTKSTLNEYEKVLLSLKNSETNLDKAQFDNALKKDLLSSKRIELEVKKNLISIRDKYSKESFNNKVLEEEIENIEATIKALDEVSGQVDMFNEDDSKYEERINGLINEK